MTQHDRHEDLEPPPAWRQDLEISVQDFYAYLPDHKYIFVPTGKLWTAAGVNAQIPPHGNFKATTWIDANHPVQQMTWAPGHQQIIHNWLIRDGGWVEQPGSSCFNLYRPPPEPPQEFEMPTLWLELILKDFPDTCNTIVRWFAHAVQHPDIKINHALVLGGAPGIGKDTILEPVMRAVGSWNCHTISPTKAMGRFSGFRKSRILRINEVRDLGETSRFDFYEHMKEVLVAPPDVLQVDEKNVPEYYIPNVCNVIYTTNHKTDGMYLPADDRRHHINWSNRQQSEFTEAYWNEIYAYYENHGYDDIAAYLTKYSLKNFNPKASPEKTPHFWAIADANRNPEEAELEDLIDRMGRPPAFTLPMLLAEANQPPALNPIREWLEDRKNRRAIPHRIERCSYLPIRNNDAKDGLWVCNQKRCVIYVEANITVADQIRAAANLKD